MTLPPRFPLEAATRATGETTGRTANGAAPALCDIAAAWSKP